jgi:precorrin-6B methylase 1
LRLFISPLPKLTYNPTHPCKKGLHIVPGRSAVDQVVAAIGRSLDDVHHVSVQQSSGAAIKTRYRSRQKINHASAASKPPSNVF